MNIIFLHRNFPAQFKHVATELANNPDNNVIFITNNDELEIQGIKKIVYQIKEKIPRKSNPYLDPYLKFYGEALSHAHAAAKSALRLKETGFKPDIIYGHDWGPSMFMKDVFPDVPFLCYFDWFYNSEGADAGFDKLPLDESKRAQIRCQNSHILQNLCSCYMGITATNWQKNQFPKEFHHKIKVLYDGIDTDVFKPNTNVTFLIKDKNLKLSISDEVITYATRGMEPYRGFPQFMLAVEKLLKQRPSSHFIIAGEDKVFYGEQLKDGTFKEVMLKNLDIDSDRVHFVGKLPYDEYVKLLQISSAHVYLTYPFVLSWSMLDAMAVGCCVIASNTAPVQEMIKDNYNGLFFDFYNINQLIEKIGYALDNKECMQKIRENSRKTIIDNYALKDLLPKHIDFINKWLI